MGFASAMWSFRWVHVPNTFMFTITILIYSDHHPMSHPQLHKKGKTRCSNRVYTYIYPNSLMIPDLWKILLRQIPSNTIGTITPPDKTPWYVHKHLDFAHGCHSSAFAHETFHYSWKITLGQTTLSLAILPKLTSKNQNLSLALALAECRVSG